MAASGKLRHRDRNPGERRAESRIPTRTDRVFRLPEDERQLIAEGLRRIDAAREQLEAQQNRANRLIIRDLKAAADHIFDLLGALEEA
jgi:hypothetical protein